MVERYNGMLRSGIHKLLVDCKEANWVQLLPEVLLGLRFLPSQVGLLPYTLAYKVEPTWPVAEGQLRGVAEPLVGSKGMSGE